MSRLAPAGTRPLVLAALLSACPPLALAQATPGCGTYLLRSAADQQVLHLNGLGDRLVSTRWQPSDDYVRFLLELQADGSAFVRSKATGQYVYDDKTDRLLSTRQAVGAATSAVVLEPALDGSVRIRSRNSGQYWHYNGTGDRLLSTRWQTQDAFSSFRLERVTGAGAVASCTTDVMSAVLTNELRLRLADRHAKVLALRKATEGYLAANPIMRQLPAGTSLVGLDTAAQKYIARYPNGVSELNVPELQKLGAQLAELGNASGAISAGLVPNNASNATLAGNALAGLPAVQAAAEEVMRAQRTALAWGRANLVHLAQDLRAVSKNSSTPVLASLSRKSAQPAQVASRGLGDATATAADTAGTGYATAAATDAAVTTGSEVIIVVTSTSSGFTLSSAAANAQSILQMATSTAVRPSGNTATVAAPVVIVAPVANETLDLFDFASQTGSFDQLVVETAGCTKFQSSSNVATIFEATANEGCTDDDVASAASDSYDRGPGSPMGCASGEVQSGALCYEQCKSGYTLVAGVCWQQCPSGYRDDGAFCAKPANYARSKYPWKFGDKAFSLDDARKRCLAANPSVGCEKQGEIIYAKCKAGYNKLLLDWCTKDCPADMGADIGVSCTKKSYPNPTPWGRPLSSCADGREKQGLLCYEKCKTGYTGNLNVCST